MTESYGLFVGFIDINSEKINNLGCHDLPCSNLIHRNLELCCPPLVLFGDIGLNFIAVKNMRMGLIIRVDILTVNQTTWANDKNIIVIDMAKKRTFKHDTD